MPGQSCVKNLCRQPLVRSLSLKMKTLACTFMHVIPVLFGFSVRRNIGLEGCFVLVVVASSLRLLFFDVSVVPGSSSRAV